MSINLSIDKSEAYASEKNEIPLISSKKNDPSSSKKNMIPEVTEEDDVKEKDDTSGEIKPPVPSKPSRSSFKPSGSIPAFDSDASPPVTVPSTTRKSSILSRKSTKSSKGSRKSGKLSSKSSKKSKLASDNQDSIKSDDINSDTSRASSKVSTER